MPARPVIADVVRELYEADDANHFEDASLGPLFDPPFVGVASADDPWFRRFQDDIIGPWHWTPQEALALVDPQATARSVVCWVLPVAEPARLANREATEFPARLWAYVRTFGEHFNSRIRQGVVTRLAVEGHTAVAPQIAPENEIALHPRVGLSSRWSERHAAFVAGLGTFGISGGLITRRGIAHRIGSVVTDLELPVTERPYGDDPFAWCLKSARDTCGACIERCPVGSVGESVHERVKSACAEHSGRIRQAGPELYGWEGIYGCGLCQTAVPCETRNPVEGDGP